MALTQIQTGMLADAAVTAAKLASGAAASNLGPGSVTSTLLASAAVKENLLGVNYAGLPPSYVKLINSRDPSKIYWCAPAASGGSDSNSGTFASPWLNPYYAIKQISDGSTLILKPGTYSYTDQDCRITGQTSTRRGILISDGYTNANQTTPVTTRGVAIIGYPNQTIINGTSVTTGQPSDDWRDFGMIGLYNPNSYVVGLIIKRNNGGRTNNYSVAIWGPDMGAAYCGTALNCVFQETNSNGYISNSYNNSNNNYMNMDNCAVLNSGNTAAYLGSYSGGTFGANNTAFQSNNTEVYNYVDGVCSKGMTFDANYRITAGTIKTGYGPYSGMRAATDMGVYGGLYAWGTW